MKKKIKVVSAIIENNNNEILCALRSNQMSIGGYWEFPGGKVEEGESLSEAIIREINEELKCEISCTGEIFNDNTHEYEEFIVNLIALKCKLISGTPTASEHAKLIWLDKDHLDSLKWAPADIPALEELTQKNL
ncbi:MAG: (deoxy)nucleoside triphosphate pyrophosphohydrolase [Sarcina sp.]